MGHPVPYRSGIKSRFIGKFSFTESVWLSIGLYFTYILFRYTPQLLPDPALGRLHTVIPLAIAAFMAFAEHPEMKVPFSTFVLLKIKHYYRKKQFFFR